MALQRLAPRTKGFVLGAMACPKCGEFFPSKNDATALGCVGCGEVVYADDSTETLAFTADDLSLPQWQLREAEKVTLESKSANVDQRATEEAHCERCKAQVECYVYALQTRGADEGQTIFFECRKCGNEWALNS